MLKSGIVLYSHQMEELQQLQEHPHYALFAEQGTGKTLPVLLHICTLLTTGAVQNALIVCPKAVTGSWTRDMEKFKVVPRRLLQRCVTVVSYSYLSVKKEKQWAHPEYFHPWGCVVLDESHYIKHRTSNRAKACIELGKLSTYRYILTGTPVGNSHWEEIWAQYRFMDPSIFGERYRAFEDRYCILNQFWKPYRYLHTDELQEKIFTHAYRVKKMDCLDLPDKLPPERWSVEQSEKKLYKEMVKNYIAELEIEATNPLTRNLKLRQLCSGFITDEEGVVHRIKCKKPALLIEFLENWNKKLVVFAHFKQSIQDVCKVLQQRDLEYVVLDGAQQDKTVWKRFQEDSNIQVIVCQYQTACAGIDLFVADTILFYEPTDSSQTFEQACDRIHRPGQVSPCSYILLETKGTVETKMWDALERHKDFNDKEFFGYLQEVKHGRLA